MNTRIELHDTRTCVTSRRRSESTQRRLELVWAWASLLALVICWDAALRLDQHVSPPRVRIAHAVDLEQTEQAFAERSPKRR